MRVYFHIENAGVSMGIQDNGKEVLPVNSFLCMF